MGTWHRIGCAGVAVVAALGMGACGSSSSPKALNGVVKATKDKRFDPDKGTVRLNKETVFTFQNDDNVEHNFTISSVFIDLDNAVVVDVKPGESKEVKFTVKQKPQAGFITYYCRFHQSQGMTGKITVT